MKNIFQIKLGSQALDVQLVQSHYANRYFWSTQRHCHADYELHILLGGSSRIEVEDRQIELQAGEGILLAPGQYHYPQVTRDGFCRFTLSFSPKTPALSAALQQSAKIGHIFTAADSLTGVCNAIFREFAAGNPYKQEQIQALLTVLMIDLLRQLSVEPPQEESSDVLTEHLRITRIDQFFETNYTRSDGEQDLADLLHLSRRQLDRVLKKNYGMNYRQKLIRTRMDNAAWLLRTKPLRISQVAQQVGYSSESAFYQAFQKQYGVTPREYYLRHRKKQTD